MSDVAFITGAGQGIGEAIAKRLADDGFKVAVVGRTLQTKLTQFTLTQRWPLQLTLRSVMKYLPVLKRLLHILGI